MTAPSLRDRIAAAWSDHETGTLHPDGYVPCACGQRLTSPQSLARHRASVMLEVLADTDPTDLGLETSGVWYCRRHSGIANEDDHRGLCPWWDHADHCDAEHDEELDDGACSPCQWVELLIPPASPRPEEQSPYEALIESIMKNAHPDYWDSGSDIEAVAYVRHLEDEVERLRRVCLRRALRTWVDEFDEEADHG